MTPTNVVAGSSASIRVEMQDKYSNLINTASGAVSLVTTGSAVVLTSAGRLSFTNGVASGLVLDLVAEIVTLSLSNPVPNAVAVSSQTITFFAGHIYVCLMVF
jgi:hypothetical protein